MTTKTNLNLIGLSATLALSLAFTGCKDDLSEDSHYKTPDFLVGNALEVLQKDGNYKTFLRGIQLIGYNDVVDSQLLTVLAPTDEAFASFLKEKGYGSIDEMYNADPQYTNEVITYHLLYYAMDWDKMTNFRPKEGDGASATELMENAGMYNRFRTRCVVPEYTIKNEDPSIDEDSLNVIHRDRYITIFSEKLFATLGIDAASNYNYFFPNTQWNPNHLANGFNVMNAAVLDTAAVVTDNGYLYHIDHVIEPVETIYDELSKNQNYQAVKSLFDQYSYYKFASEESDNVGHPVYLHKFLGLPDIADEWMTPSYTGFTENCYNSWNLFIPTDQALDKMFREYWDASSGYRSVNDLNPVIQEILLNECIGYVELTKGSKSSVMCYPDYLQKQQAVSSFGTYVNADPAEYDYNVLCNNGVIYGSNKMEVPGVLSSVAGPGFKDQKYLPYLYALNGAEKLGSMASKDARFVALIPDTFQFSHHDPAMRLFCDVNTTPVSYTLQQFSQETGEFVRMSGSVMENMANMNVTQEATELKSTGTQVIETNASFNYWFVRDGQITTNAIFNEQLNPTFKGQVWSGFHEIYRNGNGDSWSNGRTYAYDYPGVFMPAAGDKLETMLSMTNDRDYPFFCFVQLLQKSGLVSNGSFVDFGVQTIRFLSEPCRFFAIVPTNDAVKASLKSLPGCSALSINESTYAISGTLTTANKSLLAAYLLNYFVTADRASFTSYPYLGSATKGAFVTSGAYKLNIMDDGTSLKVNWSLSEENKSGSAAPEGNTVQLVDKYYYLPFAFSDGAFQMIDQVLK